MHLFAKVFGWAQFGMQAAGQVLTQSQGIAPHGAIGWISLAASLLTAIGVHAASNSAQASHVDQSK